MPAVLLVEVGAAHGAEPGAVLAAEHHEGRLHHERGDERAREVNRAVGRDELEVHLVLVVGELLGLLEEVVAIHLGVDVELGVLEAAVAGAHRVGAQDARGEDALAGVGEHDVVVDAGGKRELVVADGVAGLVEMPRKRPGVARGREALVNGKDDGVHGYQGTLLVVLRGPEFSSSVWRTRVTELVRLLRFSSRWASTVSAYSSAL